MNFIKPSAREGELGETTQLLAAPVHCQHPHQRHVSHVSKQAEAVGPLPPTGPSLEGPQPWFHSPVFL